jgi:hypothetical protein
MRGFAARIDGLDCLRKLKRGPLVRPARKFARLHAASAYTWTRLLIMGALRRAALIWWLASQ